MHQYYEYAYILTTEVITKCPNTLLVNRFSGEQTELMNIADSVICYLGDQQILKNIIQLTLPKSGHSNSKTSLQIL